MAQIHQGSNAPLVITLDSSVTELPHLLVSLWSVLPQYRGKPLKKWEKQDISIDTGGEIISCPLTEAETAAFPGAQVRLLVKGWDAQGQTRLWQKYTIDINEREDRIFQLSGV